MGHRRGSVAQRGVFQLINFSSLKQPFFFLFLTWGSHSSWAILGRACAGLVRSISCFAVGCSPHTGHLVVNSSFSCPAELHKLLGAGLFRVMDDHRQLNQIKVWITNVDGIDFSSGPCSLHGAFNDGPFAFGQSFDHF